MIDSAIDIRDQEMYETIEDHVFWKHADGVRHYVFEYLEKEFPDAFIIDELDRIDISVLDENLPVEIQSTVFRRHTPMISAFEDDIRRQVEQNVAISGRCWLFFDDALLRYIKKGVGANVSINLDWLYKYMKEEKVRIFTITYDGIVREVNDKDFNFLLKVSMTCKKGEDDDLRIMQRNKLKVALNAFIGHGFVSDEIKKLHETYYNRDDKKDEKTKDFNRWLVREGHSDRELECRHLYNAISNLPIVNKILCCCCNDKSIGTGVMSAFYLGLFERNNKDVHANDKNIRIHFADIYSIAQYIPGYLKKKDLWDFLRTHPVNQKTFYAIIRGETDYLWWVKSQINIDDAWGTGDNQNQNSGQTCSDKEVSVKIEGKDQIITINIKNTKQVDIDEAWG